jgi:hypothetical protein
MDETNFPRPLSSAVMLTLAFQRGPFSCVNIQRAVGHHDPEFGTANR